MTTKIIRSQMLQYPWLDKHPLQQIATERYSEKTAPMWVLSHLVVKPRGTCLGVIYLGGICLGHCPAIHGTIILYQIEDFVIPCHVRSNCIHYIDLHNFQNRWPEVTNNSRESARIGHCLLVHALQYEPTNRCEISEINCRLLNTAVEPL